MTLERTSVEQCFVRRLTREATDHSNLEMDTSLGDLLDQHMDCLLIRLMDEMFFHAPRIVRVLKDFFTESILNDFQMANPGPEALEPSPDHRLGEVSWVNP